MKAQRDAKSTGAGGYVRCKVCLAMPPSRGELREVQRDCREAAGIAIMHAEYIRSLIVDSMAHMLESERRQTSWCGAVKARSSSDPSNHVDESGQ